MSDLIKIELKKFDAVTPAIKKIEREYLPLRIDSVDDKEGYAKVWQALKFMISKRNEVENMRKELKADSLAFGRAVDARAKEITAMLEPIETHLRQQKEGVDAEVKRIEQEKEAARQAVIDNRIQKLMSIPYMWQTQTEFILSSKLGGEEITFMKINLETFDDEQFNEVYERMKSVSDAEQAEIQKQEEAKRAEFLKMEEERRALEAEKARVQKEIEDMKNERAAVRINALKELGLAPNASQTYYGYFVKSEPYRFENLIDIDEIKNGTNAQWEDALVIIKSALEHFWAEEAEALARNEAAMQEKIRAELEAKAAAEKQAEIEREKQLAKTKAEKRDAEQLAVFFLNIFAEAESTKPSLSSEYGKRIHQNFLTYIEEQKKKVQPK